MKMKNILFVLLFGTLISNLTAQDKFEVFLIGKFEAVKIKDAKERAPNEIKEIIPGNKKYIIVKHENYFEQSKWGDFLEGDESKLKQNSLARIFQPSDFKGLVSCEYIANYVLEPDFDPVWEYSQGIDTNIYRFFTGRIIDLSLKPEEKDALYLLSGSLMTGYYWEKFGLKNKNNYTLSEEEKVVYDEIQGRLKILSTHKNPLISLSSFYLLAFYSTLVNNAKEAEHHISEFNKSNYTSLEMQRGINGLARIINGTPIMVKKDVDIIKQLRQLSVEEFEKQMSLYGKASKYEIVAGSVKDTHKQTVRDDNADNKKNWIRLDGRIFDQRGNPVSANIVVVYCDATGNKETLDESSGGYLSMKYMSIDKREFVPLPALRSSVTDKKISKEFRIYLDQEMQTAPRVFDLYFIRENDVLKKVSVNLNDMKIYAIEDCLPRNIYNCYRLPDIILSQKPGFPRLSLFECFLCSKCEGKDPDIFPFALAPTATYPEIAIPGYSIDRHIANQPNFGSYMYLEASKTKDGGIDYVKYVKKADNEEILKDIEKILPKWVKLVFVGDGGFVRYHPDKKNSKDIFDSMERAPNEGYQKELILATQTQFNDNMSMNEFFNETGLFYFYIKDGPFYGKAKLTVISPRPSQLKWKKERQQASVSITIKMNFSKDDPQNLKTETPSIP